MKGIIKEMSSCLENYCNSFDKTHLKETISKWDLVIGELEVLCKSIGEEFEDGKINKRTLETQIESIQGNLKMAKENLGHKEREAIKLSSEMIKISQENDKLKDYVRKIKDEYKNYKSQTDEIVQGLNSKIKKYKLQYEDKLASYEAEIKYLQGQVGKVDNVGDDLDKELEELARLEEEVGDEDEN